MPVEYNPMTGGRRDLEVEREDGKKADERHASWTKKRIAYLESIIPTASDDARGHYERELATLR